MEECTMHKTADRWARVCFWLAVIVMLIVGRYTYQDYGITVDEEWERQSTLVNYQYAYEKITGTELKLTDIQLHEYRERYYGVALQTPMMVLEHLTGFTMPLRDAFLLRHLYTFGLCLVGWMCFYLFCRQVFKNSWLALLGMLMVALYPRFWGEQFTNIKDLVFAASCCASLMGVALCLEHEGKWRYEVIGAFLSALCANTRFIGFQFPALLFGYRVLRDWLLDGSAKGEIGEWLAKKLPRYVIHLVLVFAFYFLITPASWENPFAYLIGVFKTFSNYSTWGGTVLFLGKVYPGSQLPWYYLFGWILLSAPLWYLALMAVGIFDAGKALAEKQKIQLWLTGEHRYFVLCLVVAAIPLVTPVFKEVTLYNSWRHAYYVFPPLVVLALFGLRRLWQYVSRKKTVHRMLAAAVCLLLLAQVGWTAYNHPYEKVYFNPIGRQSAELVDRDYWYESGYEQLQVILRNDDTKRISLSSDGMIGISVFDFLPEEEANRFSVLYGGLGEVDYYIDGADTTQPERFDNYTPVYELRMKDGLVLSTIHIRNDLLEERFGGNYPEYNLE